MRKILAILVVMLVFGSSVAWADAPFHIGVVTGPIERSEDDFRGGQKLVAEYGDAANGGMIKHVTYPEKFIDEQEATISVIAGLADDPLMRAIVVNQGVPGTAEAFKKIREARPDVFLLVGEAHEDPNVIEALADVVINADNLARGYLMAVAAQKMGATSFVHISFPRHMSYELLLRRHNIMRQACNDLGMEFFSETAPDPVSDVGVQGSQQFILDNVPVWLEKYGKDAAFFCTSDPHTEPLLKRVAELGGYFVEADLPSPLMGYPGAFKVDLSGLNSDWPAILNKVEDAVVKQGGAKRMGTWAFSYGFATTAALGELAKGFVEANKEPADLKGGVDMKQLFSAYGKYTPGAEWNGSYYTDIVSGVTAKNHVLVYQDTYVFGLGYLGMTKLEVPDKYFQIR